MSSWTDCATSLPREGRCVVVYKGWGEAFCAQLEKEVDEDGFHYYWAMSDCGGDASMDYRDEWSYLPGSADENILDKAKSTARRYGEILMDIAGVDIFKMSRERMVSWCRYMAMWQMAKEGFTTIAIGEAFSRHHDHAVKARKEINALCLEPQMYPDLTPIFNEFRKRVTDDGQRDEK